MRVRTKMETKLLMKARPLLCLLVLGGVLSARYAIAAAGGMLPDAGISLHIKFATWGALSGMLVALVLSFVVTWNWKVRTADIRISYLRNMIPALLVLIAVSGVGYAVLFQSQLATGTPVSRPISEGSSGIKFPSTGTDPTPLALAPRAKIFFGTPADGFVSTLLILSICILAGATFRNITARKRIEGDLENAKKAALNVLEDLEEERRRLAHINARDEALLESIGEGVVAIEQDGVVIVMNRAAEDLLGYNSSELMGKSYVDEVVLEDAEGHTIRSMLRPISIALTGKASTTINCHYVRKDGTKFPVAETTTPVFLDGEPMGAIVVFRDITHEKELEKLRTDFLALASHQLRTPLSGTKWLVETLQRGIIGALNPKQKEYIDRLYQINERMIGLVADMLNVLMLESGIAVMKKQEISAEKIFDELFLMMEPASRNRKVRLVNAFKDHKAVYVQSDPQALRSILESLVSNAINYSAEGNEVIVNATEEPSAVVFSVSDTGIGIPKEEQKKIFERFYRSSNAKEFKTEGTGLGLYTAFLLAQKIGGQVYFESEENKGTTFSLRIPKKLDTKRSD